MLAWMCYAALCAVVCAAVGACIQALLSPRARRRRLVWVMTMAVSLLLPIAVPVLASLFVTQAPLAQQASNDAVESALSAATAASVARDWNGIAITCWFVCTLLLVAMLLRSQRRLERRLGTCSRIRVDGHDLLLSERFGPAVVGVFDTVIVLPAWVLALDEKDRRLVVSHEREHQRAGDPALSIAALVAAVLFPWNAALWWQLSRLRLAIELDCDARVVAGCGADPFAYGELLVTAHENAEHARGVALALAPVQSALGQRVMALVTRGAPAGGARSRRQLASAFGVAFGAIALLALVPLPTIPPVIAAATHEAVAGPDSQPSRPVVGVVTAVPAAAVAPRATRGTSNGARASRGSRDSRDSARISTNVAMVGPRATRRIMEQPPAAIAGAMRRATSATATVAPTSPTGDGRGGYYGAGGGVGRAVIANVDGVVRTRAVEQALPADKTIDRNGFMGAEVRPVPDTRPPAR